MVSLRFPFSYSPPPGRPPRSNGSNSNSRVVMAAAKLTASAAVGAGVALAVSQTQYPHHFLHKALDSIFSSHPNASSSFPLWGSLSLLSTSGDSVVESKTGFAFPAHLNGSQRLLGLGLRKKSVLGLKNIDVYAFGVYADDSDIRKLLSEKYGKLSVSELREREDFYDEVFSQDISMTVRLQIVYGRLSIRSVRNAFEESVGSRLQKFGGSDHKDLLQRFTSQFKDEYKIPRGTVIDLSKECNHVLRTKIDGVEVGDIQSKLLCRSILDLYVGDDPFDKDAKKEVEVGLASLLGK